MDTASSAIDELRSENASRDALGRLQQLERRRRHRHSSDYLHRVGVPLLALNAYAAAFVELGCLHGLDTLKVRMQASSPLHVGMSPFRHSADAAAFVVRSEGAAALYSGVVPALLARVPQLAVRFGGYELLRGAYLDRTFRRRLGFAEKATVGAAVGALEAVIVCPADAVKVWRQLSGIKYFPQQQAFESMLLPPVMRALGATLWRDCTFTATYLTCYHTLKEAGEFALQQRMYARRNPDKLRLVRPGQLEEQYVYERRRSYLRNDAAPMREEEHLMAPAYYALFGGVAGALACLVSHPFDVAKTRQQRPVYSEHARNVPCNMPITLTSRWGQAWQYAKQGRQLSGGGTFSLLAAVYRAHGVAGGLYAGLALRLPRCVLGGVVFFGVYERLMAALQPPSGTSSSPFTSRPVPFANYIGEEPCDERSADSDAAT